MFRLLINPGSPPTGDRPYHIGKGTRYRSFFVATHCWLTDRCAPTWLPQLSARSPFSKPAGEIAPSVKKKLLMLPVQKTRSAEAVEHEFQRRRARSRVDPILSPTDNRDAAVLKNSTPANSCNPDPSTTAIPVSPQRQVGNYHTDASMIRVMGFHEPVCATVGLGIGLRRTVWTFGSVKPAKVGGSIQQIEEAPSHYVCR